MHYDKTKVPIWVDSCIHEEIRTQQAWQAEKVSCNLTQGAETQPIPEFPLS